MHLSPARQSLCGGFQLAILPVIDQVIDHSWVGQRRGIAKIIDFIRRHLAQDAAHDFTRTRLR